MSNCRSERRGKRWYVSPLVVFSQLTAPGLDGAVEVGEEQHVVDLGVGSEHRRTRFAEPRHADTYWTPTARRHPVEAHGLQLEREEGAGGVLCHSPPP